MIDGKPVIIGVRSQSDTTNFSRSIDAWVGYEPAAIVNAFSAANSTEQPCFISFSKKRVIRTQAYEIAPGLVKSRRVLGDLNGDFQLTEADVEAMDQEIRNHRENVDYPMNWGFDLNDDGAINGADMKVLIEDVLRTALGDIHGGGDQKMDGIVDVLADASVLLNNLDMQEPSYFDGDLNGDGAVTVLGDVSILINNLNQKRVFRLDLDFNGDGVLDGGDIEVLTSNMTVDPANPKPYDEAFDLTTGTVNYGTGDYSDNVVNITVELNEQLAGVADGVVDRADLHYYLEEFLGTKFGDVNLSGRVDPLSDYIAINQSVLSGEGSGWSGGDLDFNGVVDQTDIDIFINSLSN